MLLPPTYEDGTPTAPISEVEPVVSEILPSYDPDMDPFDFSGEPETPIDCTDDESLESEAENG
jgi:hypothetical protein